MPPEVTTPFLVVVLCLTMWHKASYKTDSTTYHVADTFYESFNASLLSSSHN